MLGLTRLETLQPSQILTDRMNERFGDKKWRHLLDHTPNPSKKKTHFRLLTRKFFSADQRLRGEETSFPTPISKPKIPNLEIFGNGENCDEQAEEIRGWDTCHHVWKGNWTSQGLLTYIRIATYFRPSNSKFQHNLILNSSCTAYIVTD